MTFPTDTGEFMQTFTGRAFSLRHPTPDMVELLDVAHHLACINRFTGALVDPVSVAQHAVLVSFLAPIELAFDALHHDDHEAYTNDLSSPMKRTMRRLDSYGYDDTVKAIQGAINIRFGVNTESDIIKRADLLAMSIEADSGFSQIPLWLRDYPKPNALERDRVPLWILTPMDWKAAKQVYLSRHEQLLLERAK